MTCANGIAWVEGYLSRISGVSDVSVSLESVEATVVSARHIEIDTFKKALPQ